MMIIVIKDCGVFDGYNSSPGKMGERIPGDFIDRLSSWVLAECCSQRGLDYRLEVGHEPWVYKIYITRTVQRYLYHAVLCRNGGSGQLGRVPLIPSPSRGLG